MIHHAERLTRQCARNWSDNLQLGRHGHGGHGDHDGHVDHDGLGGCGEHGGHGGQHGPGLDRTKLTYNIDFPGKL